MQRQVDLVRVLHDPVGYYAPWRMASTQVVAAQRTALNAWLSERYALPAYRAPDAAQQVLSRRLIAGWERLPAVAYLLACGKQRRRLLGSPLLLALPPHVQAFLRLPFAECTLPPPVQLDEPTVRAWGAAYLLDGLQQQVPEWLLARARLCFADLHLPPLSSPLGAADFDMTCFWSAWNHAAHVS